ncbi:unnamed protein product [Aureobasidium pullulans]|nr:unnamed protein product [Aureobasidium pullulans]
MICNFWSTVSVFIDNGATLEDKIMRWQHALKNLYYIIGRNQKEEHGTFDGGITPETLKLVQSAAEAVPYHRKQKAPTTKAAVQEQVELDEQDPTPTRTRNRRGEPLTPPPTSESASKAAVRTSPRSTASTWPMFWQRMATTYKESKWVAGVSKVLTHMITHNGVDDVVKLTNKLYETRDIVALNNATKTKTQLRYSKDEAQSVAVQYKALWEAMESSALPKCMTLLANRNLGQALRDLERQLDQIDDDSGQQQLGDFARLYLENRSQGTRLRDTPETLHSLLNTTSNLERAYRDYIFAVIIVYENTAEVTRQITQQYHDFHKKVDCEMEGSLENVAGVLKGFRLEESDEDALISLMKRHGAKVKEITQLRAAMGIKSNAVELPAETTTTAKLAGGVLHRRFFE